MTKRKSKKYITTDKPYVITSDQLFNAEKTKWNGFGVGYGVHGDTKYNRRKAKCEAQRRMDMDWG